MGAGTKRLRGGPFRPYRTHHPWLPLQGSWPSPRGLRGFGTARVQRMPPGTRRPGMPGPYRVTKLRIFRERHPYGRPGADLALQVNFCVVQQGNVLDDGKP